MAYELKFEIVDLCWIRRSTHKCSSSEGHGRRSHRRDCETGLLRFLTVFIGPDERWHKIISARTIGDPLKVRTPAYSFDEVSHIAQSCRALASVRIVLSLLVHVSTLWVRTRGHRN